MYCIAALNSLAIWSLRATGNDFSGILFLGRGFSRTLAQ
jgi:hypothetical protein